MIQSFINALVQKLEEKFRSSWMPLEALTERSTVQYFNNCKVFVYHHVAIQKTLSCLSFLDLGFFSPKSNSFLILSSPEHPSSKYQADLATGREHQLTTGKRKGLNMTSRAQFATLPLVKPVVWFARAVVNWPSRSVAKSAYSQTPLDIEEAIKSVLMKWVMLLRSKNTFYLNKC